MEKSAAMKIPRTFPRPSLFALRSAMISIALLLIALAVIQRVEHRVTVWTLTHDLAAGTSLRAEDLRKSSVTLNAHAVHYLDARTNPKDWIALQDLFAGEILSARSVNKSDENLIRRIVSISVEENHLPAHLLRGQKIDLYVTPMGSQNDILGAPERVAEALVVEGTNVQGVHTGVALSVLDQQVSAIVEAAQRGHLDVVGYPK